MHEQAVGDPSLGDGAVVQAQRDASASQEDETAVLSGHALAERVADRVYELLRKDLRLERERVGWHRRRT